MAVEVEPRQKPARPRSPSRLPLRLHSGTVAEWSPPTFRKARIARRA